MTIPQDLAIVLTALAALISNWLQGDGLPRWQNALIAATAFIILSVTCMWLIGGFNGDLKSIVLYFIGLAVILAGNELVSLLKYVQAGTSPLAPKITATRRVTDWNRPR
jgi:hypothetical protein